MIDILLFIVFWILCSLLSIGWDFAYFQTKYKRNSLWKKDLKFAITLGVFFGPISTITAYFQSEFAKHGWFLIPKHIKQKNKI